MYHVKTLDQFGRVKQVSEWLSGQLAVDALKTFEHTLGYRFRDAFIEDTDGDIVYIASSDLACEVAINTDN